MKNFQVNSLLFSFFTILKLFTDGADAATLGDLKILCGMMNGTQIIKNIPTGCTTVVVQTKSTEDLSSISLIKGNVPVLLIEDSHVYADWLSVVKENSSIYAGQVETLQVDFIAFEFMYDKSLTSLDKTFTINLVKWLTGLKCQAPDVLFGAVIPVEIEVLSNSVDIAEISCIFDFFILNSEKYRECEFKENQQEMELMVKSDELEKNILDYQTAGVDICKLIYTIYIQVYSVRIDEGGDSHDFTYAHLCANKMHGGRRYCIDTIDNIFSKARICTKLSVLGVFARNSDWDDDGSCQCVQEGKTTAAFPELNIILQASQETIHSVDYYKCKSGEFPKIL